MISRRHSAAGVDSWASYSDDLVYRFALTRRWAPGPLALFVMLNPSTATETQNDPTIARCQRRARAWGFAGLAVANLFGLRATRPQALRRAADPVGAGNDAQLLRLAAEAGLVICAWGGDGAYLGRDQAVAALLRGQGQALHALALTRAGAPRHPLYLPYALQPRPWAGSAAPALGG